MRSYGYLVMAKQGKYTPTTHAPNLAITPSGRRARSFPLEPVTHDTPNGPCTHLLATIDGAVVALDLNEAGDPTVVATLTRGPVKRARRAGGQYHFNVGYTLACPRGETTIWLQPHATKDGNPHRPRPAARDPHQRPRRQRLLGIRSDAVSFHAMYKRTLIVKPRHEPGRHPRTARPVLLRALQQRTDEYRHRQQTLATAAQRRPLRPLRRATTSPHRTSPPPPAGGHPTCPYVRSTCRRAQHARPPHPHEASGSSAPDTAATSSTSSTPP